jgi:hypothetical protein
MPNRSLTSSKGYPKLDVEAAKSPFRRLKPQTDHSQEKIMMITLTDTDLSKLKPATRADIVAVLLSTAAAAQPSNNHPEGFKWDEVVDLNPSQVEEFMQGCAPQTIAGLKVIAEHGPVIAANLLLEAGIDNYGHFQGRVTKRTRTITGDKHAFLFTWDDWSEGENAERGYGHYAVTETTLRSLRDYFGLN